MEKSKKYIIEEELLDNKIVNESSVYYQAHAAVPVFSNIYTIRKGILYAEFERITRNCPFTNIEWASFLHLTSRTMLRYKTENKSFDALSSERIFEITKIYNKGIEVFEDKDNFDIWLNSDNPSLGNTKPKTFFDTTLGINLIENTLIRMEHGVLA